MAKEKFLRTTVIFTEALGANLKHYAVNNGVTENMVIRTALEEFLKKKGYQTDKIPKGSKPIYD